MCVLFSVSTFAQKKATQKVNSTPVAAKPAATACDCKDAVKININKAAKYGETQSPKGFGGIQEITAKSKTDKLNFEQEHNSAWYLLTINIEGEFTFEITPKDSSNDYDFLVYKYTDTNFCSDLLAKKLKPIRSNLSRDNELIKGLTGLLSDGKNEFVGQGIGNAWSKSMQVTKGQKYMLVLDNVYPDGQGHTIRFNCLKTVTIAGTVLGPDSLPMKAEVVLSDNNGTTVTQFNTGPDGKYSITTGIKEGVNYTLALSSDNSFIDVKIINTTEIQKQPNSFTDIRTVLPKLKKGEKYKLRNINFQAGNDILLVESFPSVEALYRLMKKNKKMVIRIEGHINGSRAGSVNESWQELSEMRAKRVYDYLVKKGIEQERIQTIGYSDRMMLYPNAKNEIEASANRRVEINVLSIE